MLWADAFVGETRAWLTAAVAGAHTGHSACPPLQPLADDVQHSLHELMVKLTAAEQRLEAALTSRSTYMGRYSPRQAGARICSSRARIGGGGTHGPRQRTG
jgi:hypothetical protein